MRSPWLRNPSDSNPLTLTITCPACGETLTYGIRECSFCETFIEEYPNENAAYAALVTQASRSAIMIRSLRMLVLLPLALAVAAFPGRKLSLLIIALIVSIPNLVAPIRWLQQYGGLTSRNEQLIPARKGMRTEVYVWLGTIIAVGIGLAVWYWRN